MKIKLSTAEPPVRTGRFNKSNEKYGDVYRYVADNPNQWVKIENLTISEIASVRQYYSTRRIPVETRVSRDDNNIVLYIKWNKREMSNE